MKKLADISLFESIENRSFGSSVFNEVNKPGFQEFDPEQDARSRLRGLSDLNADDVYDTIRHFAQQVHLGEITPDEARRYLRSVYGIDYRQINGFLRRYNLKKQMEEAVQREDFELAATLRDSIRAISLDQVAKDMRKQHAQAVHADE